MNERLTGRIRHRLGYESAGGFRPPRAVLVLQVEVSREDGPPDGQGMPAYLAAVYWRDARVEDMHLIT